MNPSQKDSFRKTLSMPLYNLNSVGLPNRATGAASKKPYLEFYGSYGKGKLDFSYKVKRKKAKNRNQPTNTV